jgi:hypothetical protein
MAGSKSDRKIDATFNIFANNQDANDAVRVGYIDPKRGYISGLSVYEANKYAERNPGTQFIIANRDKVRYININEVNRLKNSDTLPKHRPSGLVDRNSDEFDPCNTVRGFKTDPDTLGEPEIKPLIDGDSGDFDATANYDRYGSDSSKCRTRVELQGGGGIGAVATPIIGKDGSIIHVRVVHGGFGYKYPPQVRIVDDCRRGAGARGYSRLGSTGYVEENFDEDTDVENYDFSLGEYNFDPDDSAWGSVYSMDNQTVIGDWNPANVISLTSQTGFHKELQDYLGFLKGYDPNKPWWTTRDETPVRVTGDGASKKSNRLRGILFPVQHPAWGGEKSVSKDLVSVEFEVYGQGTRGNRSITYEFTAQDGSHKFKVKGIQSEKVNEKTRVDVIKVKTNTTYNVVASVIKGRGAKSEVIEQGLLENAGRNAKENREFQNTQRSATIFGDIVASLNDNDDIQITAKRGKFKASNRRLVEVKVPDDVREKFKDQPNRFRRFTFDLTYRVNVPSKEPRTIKPSFMNNYAVSPQLESDQPGTDKAGKPYSFFYKEHFPHDGVYTFRGSSDNISEIIFDGESIMDISNTFNSKPVKVKKEVKEGLHEIRIDLLNTPQKAKPKPITKDLSITYYGLNKGITKTVRGEKSYAIRTEGASRTAGRKVVSNGRVIKFDDDAGNGFDENARLTIESTSPGVSARFNDNGTQMIVKGKGTVSLKFKWDDKPNISGLSVGTLKVGNGNKVSWTSRQKGTKGSDSKTITVSAEDSKEVLGTGGFTVSRDSKSVKMRDGDGKDINSTFSIEDSTNNARFSGDGKRLITDGPGNVELKLNWNDDPNKFGVAIEKISVGGVVLTQSGEKGNVTKTLSIQADGFTVGDGNIPATPLKSFNQLKSIGTIFNTADYIKKANRPLYKVRPGVGKSGDFFSRNGVTPFNPVELDPEIPAVPPTVPPKPFKKPQAKFIKRGNDLFLKIIGDGRAKINFRLKTDDNLRTSGVFAREIRIQADGPDVRLKRSIQERTGNGRGAVYITGEEKEKIFGQGVFTSGREYKVHIIGGSSTSGFKPVDNTVIFDDDYDNGLDENGALSIRNITALDQPKSEPPKSPKNGRNNSSNKNLDNATGSADAYAGIHKIVWRDVEFPASGTYNVDVQVDDNVRLEIFNKKFRAQKLDVIGFKSGGKSNGKQTLAVEVQKGKYTIEAYLEQIPGKSIYDGNPMGLAVNIKAAYVTEMEEVTLLRSWNQNPFGAALTIHAPPPPIPTEPVVEPDGPCPPNPIWTTRQPAENQWHPVSHRFASGRRSWSRFMNRYAMSPVLPIGTKNSGYSGSSWDNTWFATIPYTGFYNFKGTVDNFAKVTISQDPDTSEVDSKKVQEIKKINGFRTEKANLTSNKIFLEKGKARIDINVRNGEKIKYKQVTTKVFNTADWLAKASEKPDKVSVDFDVYGQGSKKNMGLKFIFKEKGGDDTFTIDNVGTSNATEKVSKRVKRNTDYKVTAIATGSISSGKQEYNLKFDGLNRANNPIEVSGKNSTNQNDTLKLRDGHGNDANAKFTILSSSPGVNAKFSDDGRKLIAKGKGDVTIRLKWNDNPGTAGVAVKSITIGDKTWKQTGRKGEVTKTLSLNKNTSTKLVPEQGTLRRGSFGSSRAGGAKESPNQTDVIFADVIGSANDNDDMQVRCSRGIFTPSNKRKGIKGTSGQGTQRRNTYDLTFRVDAAEEVVKKPVTSIGEGFGKYDVKDQELSRSVTVGGPNPNRAPVILNPTLTTYKTGRLGPFLTPFLPLGTREGGESLQGRTWEMVWENVNFPIAGDYKMQIEADDSLEVFIGENLSNSFGSAGYKSVGRTSTGKGVEVFAFNVPNPGKRDIKLILQNIKIPGTTFRQNPTVAACKITCEVPVEVADTRSWLSNPVGVSAVLLAPPCKREVGGIGTVTAVEIVEPGNTYPPQEGGVPSQVILTEITPGKSGIGYTSGDVAEIVGTGITLPIKVGEFGKIVSIGKTEIPITTTPVIDIRGPGKGFIPNIITQVRIDTPEVDPETVIQVTDLAGLKQTGYVEGRPYYGEVFFKDGTPFAGRYETAGRLIQVYATLQESIDAEVTTRPSAIQRSGTDVNSNNPRLDIPGTPDNLA